MITQAASIAQQTGNTISDIVNSMADWSKLGYDSSAATELARVASLYQNVGDNIDLSTATSSLISTLQGFKISANDAEAIIDKFNEVDMLASFHSNMVASLYGIDSNYIGQKLEIA